MLMVVTLAGVVAAAQMLSADPATLPAGNADADSMETTAEGLISYAYGVWKDGMTSAGAPLTTTAATALVNGANRPAVPSGMQISSFTITALNKQGLDATTPEAVPSLSRQAASYEYAVRVTLTATNATKGSKVVNLEGIVRHDLAPRAATSS
jgi:hypothetical protein